MENHKNKGFPSNTDPDPLKITKLPSKHSMFGHPWHASETPLNGVLMVGRWWPAYSLIWIHPVPPSSNKKKRKKKKKKNVIRKLDHISQNLLDLRLDPSPHGKSQKYRVSSNTYPDPLKITKLPSKHSMFGHHPNASETPFKWCFAGGPMMAC